MQNHRKNLIENVAICMLCGLLVVATLIVKLVERDELDDDGYELDDWDGVSTPFRILDDVEPLDSDSKNGIFWL